MRSTVESSQIEELIGQISGKMSLGISTAWTLEVSLSDFDMELTSIFNGPFHILHVL